VTRLARLAGHAREDERFWRALEEDRFRELTSRDPAGNVSIKIGDLMSPLPMLARNGGIRGFPPEPLQASTMALTRRLVRRIVAELQGNRHQLTARHVHDVLDLTTKSISGSRVEIPGIGVRRVFDRLVFSPVSANGQAEALGDMVLSRHEFEYVIPLPGTSKTSCIVVPEIQRRFDLKMIDWPSARGETIQYRGAVDFERLQWPLVLRNWRPGDSYRPQGCRRVRKLKRLFLESRVPKGARTGWPVLTSAGKLVWASGYPVAEEFAPSSETRTGLIITEEQMQRTSREP
jgi:tRNA(Ile)-lysidine synthase